MLKLIDVTKRFVSGEIQTTALHGINLEIGSGEYVAISGPSGCGKSTLLSVIGLLDSVSEGEYWFEGEPAAGRSEVQLNAMRRGRIGFIFQNFNLIEELTVKENVELALAYSDVSSKERDARVKAMLQRLGVEHRANHRPSQLSGGQQQRVAIARALVARPKLLLADEPTGNLDSMHGEEVMSTLAEINTEGTTIVMVTHTPEHAAHAKRVIHLMDGRVVEDSAGEDVLYKPVAAVAGA
jgi:putative ABC transport system ATP-binding protein